ncbi:LAME_0G06194g1_1 [Lachancea meyersii CBS 8951]|uniref:LAME_0G06194g1_1 n=1 Tax=Lachancea meyersii CBS 8951 TaxID=1266667 RepID=A0A1G4K7H9_9SACH|nr:LAME_0G06194g1_1 [Lachancea meyersii CBS 8951]
MADLQNNGRSLQDLPSEILINILSHLDEKDLYAVQMTCKSFLDIVNDEELWKNLFVAKIHTMLFPSFSRSWKYSVEYVKRNRGLNEWKHNRAVKTKYTVTAQNQYNQLEKMVFDYPRCACYSDGVIMLVQLHSKRRKDRLTYMPCTTPQGCSTMHFNINAAVFGRFDGRVFGKLLTNKSHLHPVTEFNAVHRSAVTAITTAALEDSAKDWCVSGCESGQVIWWCEMKMQKYMQVSDKPILKLALHKDLTVIMDSQQVFIVDQMNNLHKLDIPPKLQHSLTQLQHFQVDFGGRHLILGNLSELYVISIDPHKDFGFTRSISFQSHIENVFIDDVTSKRTQDSALAGGDGCFVGLTTSDNSVTIINVRAPGPALRIQTKLSFEDRVHAAQVNNLVVVCAFSGYLSIFDAADGTELRVVRKTEKIPQFLGVSHGRMIVGSGNVLHYLQYIDEDSKEKKSGSSQSTRSNKWNEVLNTQLDLYNEDENSRREEIDKNERLRKRFMGDLDDEEIQYQIALMESQASAARLHSTPASSDFPDQDEELLRAIEESRLICETPISPQEADEDMNITLAIQESQEEENRRLGRRPQRRNGPIGEVVTSFAPTFESRISEAPASPISSEMSTQQNFDEDLELALALSMQEQV